MGLDKTMVKLVCDPMCDCNTHRLEVKGEFGHIVCETDNLPFPSNPATSYLAALGHRRHKAHRRQRLDRHLGIS